MIYIWSLDVYIHIYMCAYMYILLKTEIALKEKYLALII